MAKAIKKSTKKESAKDAKPSKVKSVLNDKSMQFVHHYLNANAPTGFEAKGQRIWLDYLTPYIDTHFVDSYGTVVGVINPDAPYKVVIEAHADEIAWYVKYITNDGFIYVARNGGSDHMIAPSMRVHIHTRKGKVDGVFGWPAIHVRTPDTEKKPATDNKIGRASCRERV